MEKTILEMPKVILHLHLDGSLRPETVAEWLDEDLEEVKQKLMVDKDCRDLNQYLEKFDLPSKVLQTKENIERATYELFEDLSKQNVIYAEIRFAPSKHLEGGLSYEEVVAAAIQGMNSAKEEFEIDGNLILCCMRGDKNKEENLETVKVAKKYLDKGVCALDLAGAEALYKTENFADIFEEARKNGIPFTIHAGEADGPESIKKALELGAKRIGHGVRCIEDEMLMRMLASQEIPLEICPTSNLQTQAIQGKHPIEYLYRRGIGTTISTDNNTVSNVNILEEYKSVLENTNLNINDLINMNLIAARNIFAPVQKRVGLIKEISEYKNRDKNKEK